MSRRRSAARLCRLLRTKPSSHSGRSPAISTANLAGLAKVSWIVHLERFSLLCVCMCSVHSNDRMHCLCFELNDPVQHMLAVPVRDAPRSTHEAQRPLNPLFNTGDIRFRSFLGNDGSCKGSRKWRSGFNILTYSPSGAERPVRKTALFYALLNNCMNCAAALEET